MNLKRPSLLPHNLRLAVHPNIQVRDCSEITSMFSYFPLSGLAPSQRLKMLAIRRKKSQSLADLHDKSLGSLTSPVQEPTRILTKESGTFPHHHLSKSEESGYDSDTRKSAETVSPKSSDKSDESDSGQDTSGSFTSETNKDSDTDADNEPHYQVSLSLSQFAIFQRAQWKLRWPKFSF